MALKQFVVKDATTIRDDILRVIKNGLIRRGVTDPNVGPNSDFYVTATSLGNELAVVGANNIVKCDEQMPDTAIDAGLERIGAIFDLTKQASAGSIGSVVITSSATSPISTGTILTDVAGLKYRVSVGGNYANGASVPIEAVDTGAATNRAQGDILKWRNAPPFCSDQAAVDVGGLVNGIDAEDQENFRTRVIAKLQDPPGSGNWEHASETAEDSTPRVQKAFVYPAVQGPATTDVAVTAAPTSSSKNRDVALPVMTGTVTPYIRGKLPEHANITTTTVTNNNVDVAYGLSLPEAETATPPGPGGGWVNGTPWPNPDAITVFVCTVTATTSSTSFTVDAQTSPTINVSRIAWLSPIEWKLYTALVTSVSGTAGAYVITLDRPFTGIDVGHYIWPEAVNAQAYVDAVLARFSLMGPGEKTSNSSALQRGFRHPPPATSWPYAIGPHLLRAVEDAGEEVEAAMFFHRFNSQNLQTLEGNGGQMVPTPPLSLSSSPRQFVPRNIAFYRIP